MKQEHLIAAVGPESLEKLIVIGGMHGNEKSGLEAIERVLGKLKDKEHLLKKRVYFLKGNLKALKNNERFVDIDLNRIWSDRYLHSHNGAYDFKEFIELQALIDDICEGAYEHCALLDLHTFSADSGIFCIPAENLKSERLARRFGIPFIEKLAKSLPETALNYYGEKGMLSLVFEGGKHNTPEATDNLERAIWLMMWYFDVISSDDFPHVKPMQRYLVDLSVDLPHRLEMVYHHKLKDYHHYRMHPGYYNFKAIAENEEVAIQNGKPVFTSMSGFMLMPLYQKKGSDGFFIVKEIKNSN